MKNLKELRNDYNFAQKDPRKKITQEMIANELGIKKDIVSKTETGLRKPTPEDILCYHRMLNVSAEYILDDSLKAKRPENERVGEDLGVTDNVADTMLLLKNLSSDELDYTAVLNAFIGNGTATLDFITNISTYLYSQYVNGNNSTMDALTISTIMTYIDHFVKPQLQEVFRKRFEIEVSRQNEGL